jgi:CRP/FNR family transcriptional regulator, cyclic AMP receptor protein
MARLPAPMPSTSTIDPDTRAPGYRVWGPDEVLYGPIDLLTLVSWVKRRRIAAGTWVFSEQSHAWAKAASTPELKPVFEGLARSKGIRTQSALQAGVSVEVLNRVKLLARLSRSQLQSFLQYMEILTLEPLTCAVREGDRGNAMFLILEGEVRVRLVRDGKETTLATLGAGECFGEVSLLDQGPRSADVVANERSTLLKISTASFEKLRAEAPALAEPFLYALSKSLVGRLRVTNKRYHDSVLMLRVLE